MSKPDRENSRISKKDKGRGDPSTAASSSGQGPGSSSQPTLRPHSSHRPTPVPRSDDQSTPNLPSVDQRIADRRSTATGRPIKTGIYIITNVQHDRVIHLEDPNDKTPLRGHHMPENRHARWRIISRGNEEYSIQNVEHKRYANCGPLARLKAIVEGRSSEQRWRIQPRPTGEYTIAATITRNLWMLPNAEPGTPIELFNIPTDRRCWWTFTRPEIGAPANEYIMTQPTLPERRLLLTSSSGQRNPDLHPKYPRSGDQRTLYPHSSSRRALGTDPSDQETLEPPSRGLGPPDPRSRSQPTFHPLFGHQPTPDPHSGGQATPKLHSTDQPINDTSSGGQNIVEPSFDQGDQPTDTQPIGRSTLDPRSSGQPIDNGIYIITNVRHNRFIYLEDPNDDTPLRGHYNPENRNAQWHVKSWGNEEYTIRNVDHDRYAYCRPGAQPKASVEGRGSDQLWLIQALPTGEYTIATTDTGNFWMLPYGDPDTPVELFNVRTDRKCWWTFEIQEIGDPVNEHATTQPTLFEPKPLLIPSSGYHNPDLHSRQPRSSGQHTQDPHSTSQQPPDVYLDLISAITESTDVLEPLNATCRVLKAVLKAAKDIDQVNEDWKVLVRNLRFHLATVENHIAKLEEDEKIDGTTPDLDQAIKEPLEIYAKELEEIYKLLLNNQLDSSSPVNEIASVNHNKGKMADKTRNLDDIFQTYTVSLHEFAARSIKQMQPEFHGEFLQEAKRQYFNQLKVSNAYGVQHVSCIPGTRLKALQAIRDWVDEESSTKPIFFLLDVAGSGKSTVAKHMAEEWTAQNRLLARFFFSRDTTDTMSTKSFCSIVAGAFADLDPKFKKHMDEFMARPNVGLLPFEKQFEGLVANPLRALNKRAVLTIDALDECNNEYGSRDQLLETLHAQQSSLPLLRVLATGRPERDIKHWAEEKFGFGYATFIQLEGGDKDVEAYIKLRLRPLPIVRDRLYPVIQHAEGLFIWARIACDLLVNSDDVDGLLEELGKEVSLDYLYKVALEQSMPKDEASRRAMVLVLQMILAAREPLSIAELGMLSPKPGVVEKVVTRLGSVLLYQGREDPIRLLHATFREFLTVRSKADMFFTQPELGHHTLVLGCLNAITHVLKQDDSALHELDTISDRKNFCLLVKVMGPSLFNGIQKTGSE